MDAAVVAHNAPAEGEAPHVKNPTNACYICGRQYERQDHLSRHLKSHDNERSYKCPDCGKGFNRV